MTVSDAILGRRSCRAFRSSEPSRAQIEAALGAAAGAPSAVNLQPWRVWVAAGEELDRLKRELLRSYRERGIGCSPGGTATVPGARDRGPGSFGELASVLEAEGRDLASFIDEGSCSFYGAPVGVFCFLAENDPPQRLLDCGVWLGYLLLAAEGAGLATCPLGLLAAYADVLRDVLFVPDGHRFACAVALGYPDDAAVNRAPTPRCGLEAVQWVE